MKFTEKFLKEILVDSNLISERDFNLAKKEAFEKNLNLDEFLIEKGLISDEELGQLIADKIGFPFVNLRKIRLNPEILEILPEIVAEKRGIIVFDKTKEGLKVAMENPEDLEIREFIERKTGEKVIPYFATKRMIKESLKFYGREIKEEFEKIVQENIREFEKRKAEPSLPIIRILDLILTHAYKNRASDIHLEPYAKKSILRYRIDGVLHDVLELPKEIHNFLVSRIKILANLRTDISNLPQDGHFIFETKEERVDIRVSTAPIEEGEKVVMRVLSEKIRRLGLEELGLEKEDLEILKKNIEKPWGMILVAGPTGCGKTTTLYAILEVLNKRELNITTIEDPIEYDIEGINQIQVDEKIGLTFSTGLKAIMRQNPDIIMVGEMRDQETAKLAIDAAMTGHLVLSTFHATDSATVLTRLLDMGIEPFLITSTVNLVIAQRLVRRICPRCIESYEIPFSQLSKMIGEDLAKKLPRTIEGNVRTFRGKGCSFCQKTGYFGRIGIFELLEMKEEIKKLIMEKANASQIRERAKELGMKTMIEDGLKKAEVGITTIEEILRVLK
jgi:type IV pilus assembly protein PilB